MLKVELDFNAIQKSGVDVIKLEAIINYDERTGLVVPVDCNDRLDFSKAITIKIE